MGKNLFFCRGNYWWKLIEVTNKDHLDAAKPLPALRSVQAEKLFHAVEKICSNHGDLINNNGIELFVNVAIWTGNLFHLFGCYVRLEVEE